MPSVRRTIPWTRKPPLGYGVNWSNPLTNGLLAFFPCNEGGGAPVDLCYGLKLTTNTTAGTWGQDVNGIVYNTSGAGAGASMTTPSYLKIQPPVTIVWSGNILNTPTVSSYVFGTTYSSTGINPYGGTFVQFTTSPTAYQLVFATSSSTYSTLNSTTQSIGTSWLACTIVSGSQNIYVNNPWTANATAGTTITSIAYAAGSELVVGESTFQTGANCNSSHSYALIYNRILSNAELNQLYTCGPWGMIAPAQRLWTKQLTSTPYTFGAAGLGVSGAYGGTGATLFAPLGGLSISGGYGGAVFPGIISPAAGLGVSGAYGGATAGPSPGAAGLAISGGCGGTAETVTAGAAGLAFSGYPGGITSGYIVGPFYLPYEYTSVLIATANTNPFDIDPEQTTIITKGLTSSD